MLHYAADHAQFGTGGTTEIEHVIAWLYFWRYFEHGAQIPFAVVLTWIQGRNHRPTARVDAVDVCVFVAANIR